MALLAFEGFEGLGNDSTNPPDDVVDRRYFFPSDSNDFYVVDQYIYRCHQNLGVLILQPKVRGLGR